jgi:hypothetical protein
MSNTLQIDLSALDSVQLATFAAVSPEFEPYVRAERRSRSAYQSWEEGFTDLAQAQLNLDNALQLYKNTAATKAVKDSGIVEIVNRLLARAEVLEIPYKAPVLEISNVE